MLRGLEFEFALITSGPTFGRAPSDRKIAKQEVLSLDTGGHVHGYLADMARMTVLGEPTAMMNDLLDEVLSVQAAARNAIMAGSLGSVIYEAALQAVRACSHHSEMNFVAHGMGLIAHEAPRLTGTGPIPYADRHARRPHGYFHRDPCQASASGLCKIGRYPRGHKLGVRGFRRLGQELERSITRKSFEFRDFRAKDFLLAVEKQE